MEPYAYISPGQVVRRGLVKGVQVLRKYLLLGEDSFVTRTAFIDPLGIICAVSSCVYETADYVRAFHTTHFISHPCELEDDKE